MGAKNGSAEAGSHKVEEAGLESSTEQSHSSGHRDLGNTVKRAGDEAEGSEHDEWPASAASSDEEGSTHTESTSTTGSQTQSTAGSSRSRSGSYGNSRERVRANKVCTGSFSRGIERFRSESPAAAKAGNNGPHAATTNTCPGH